MGAYRELELTLQSAQELKNVNLITRMDVYAVVSISGDPLTRQCTEPDTYGGRNPCWDATFRFAVPPTAASAAGASLHVLLRAERFLGDRDVGEVVVPLAEILAGASGAGPQPPQVASYQVRKLHRWEPRGVLNVSYRLGPVVAPVLERAAPDKPPAAAVSFNAYAPGGVPQQPPPYPHPSAFAYQSAPAPPAPSRPPAVRVVAEHDEAAASQSKPPPVATAYPASLPQQQASHPPAKPDVYRPPPPPPPRPARHEEARAPTPPPTNGRSNNGGLGQAGPTHVYMGPHSQIIFGSAPTTTSGPPKRTASPARSTISPAAAGKKGDGNWALVPRDTTQGNWASAAAESTMSVSVISPRSRKEDQWRPSGLSQPEKQQQATSSPVAAAAAAAASPFSSRSSSFSSPLSPYSSAQPSPSPTSAHSSNNPFRSASPLPSSSPMAPNHSRGAAVSSPSPLSSPLAPKHSTVVPSLSELALRGPS